MTADIYSYDLICHIFGYQIDLAGAKEYKKGIRTSAIYTSLNVSGSKIDIFHDFSAGYERASFQARFVFEEADIDILGWVPTEMCIKSTKGKQVIKVDEDREIIYRRLVTENISDLGRISHEDSMTNLKRVTSSSDIAFKARS